MNIVRTLAAILLAAVSCGAMADRGQIVESVPMDIDKIGALSIVRDGFSKLGWTAAGNDADSVSATYVGQNIEARVRVFIEGRTLNYEESATDLGAARRGATASTRTPARWINALRAEVDNGLRLRADVIQHSRSQAPAQQKLPPSDRMAELRKMRDAGLISGDEYEKKRAEILKDL